MGSKYKGIDSRRIKCCCNDPKCIESGISFNENTLEFHFLEMKSFPGEMQYVQTTKSMLLNKETVKELIQDLKQIKFK